MIKESTRIIDLKIIAYIKSHPALLLKEIAAKLNMTEDRINWARRRTGFERRINPRKMQKSA